MTDIISLIRKQQRQAPVTTVLEPQRPEMFYIGCIDARLDPVKDIGIPQGKALIYRNVGALVPPYRPEENGNANPESVSIGAALELFLGMDNTSGQMRHIVVSGHTHCGGIQHACAHHHEAPKPEGFLMRYLSLLADAMKKVFGDHVAADDFYKMRELEHESVRRSVANLKQYPPVAAAMAAGKVEVHGWVIDTATRHIEEMGEHKKFTSMADTNHVGRISQGESGVQL